MNTNHSYQILLAIIGNVFDAHATLLFLPDSENKEHARLVSAWCPTRLIAENIIIESGKGYVGWVMRDLNSSPFLVPHADIQLGSLGYYDDTIPPLQTFLACPIAGGGVLVMDSLSQDAFNEDAQKLFALFGKLIPQIQTITASSSLSLEISKYFYAIEAINLLVENYSSWVDYLKALLKIISEASGFEYAVFVSKPENSDLYTVESENIPLVLDSGNPIELPAQAGIVGWVLKNEENIFNEGLNQPCAPIFGKVIGVPTFHAAMCLSVQMEKTTYACICLASRSGRHISPELRTFMKLVSSGVSQLLERLSLRHRLRLALAPK